MGMGAIASRVEKMRAERRTERGVSVMYPPDMQIDLFAAKWVIG